MFPCFAYRALNKTNNKISVMYLLFECLVSNILGWLVLRTPGFVGRRILRLLAGIPQELRFPGIPDANLALFDSRNPSRNPSSWQEFLL
jgi:hypothetical protein